jgi:hypothetical protein
MLTPAHRAAVLRLARALPLERCNWALTGSVGHALQGVPLACHDVDVQADRAGAYLVAEVFADEVTLPVRLRTSATIRSHFGRLVLRDTGVEVEVMGALQRRRSDRWLPPVDPADHRRLVVLGGTPVPVMGLAHEARAYEELGRSERARMLRAAARRTP